MVGARACRRVLRVRNGEGILLLAPVPAGDADKHEHTQLIHICCSQEVATGQGSVHSCTPARQTQVSKNAMLQIVHCIVIGTCALLSQFAWQGGGGHLY